ncbi:MAG: acyl-CoA carboxylase subunit beta [Bacteroidetes bacterium]|nr:acyl-CoA carboxylase subunit beta [Bacteroidota bacterium]
MKDSGSWIQHDSGYLKNEDFNKNLLRKLEAAMETVRKGGGEEAATRQKKRGKLLARERIASLVDPDTSFLEIGTMAAFGHYEEHGGAPSAGIVTGIGKIHGRDVVIVANDSTVKAGAYFPLSIKKHLRAQEVALQNRIPIIYLVDSAGVFLPMQSEIFPDKSDFGRIFYNNAILSSQAIVQIAAVMGPCVAGGAYLPIMSDESIIVEGTGSVFLAGPYLVKAAIGEETDVEELGGADTHSSISGITDYKVESDSEAIELIRELVSKIGKKESAGFDRAAPHPPKLDPKEIYGIIPIDRTKPYDMYEIIGRIVDNGEIDEYKAAYGKSLICAYARIDGWAVGIVSNQRTTVRSKKPDNSNEMQIGGVIYSESADKAARFIMNCNQRRIPLVFLQDVTGFMVGTRAERGGIIKDGAKMVNAVANSTVPRFTIIVGNSFGAGNYAMCGKAYDPRLIFAWPSARIAVMGGEQASQTLLSIRLQQMERDGRKITEEEQTSLLKEIKERYEIEMDPSYAAARLWVDEIIDPLETREVISRGIEIADQNPFVARFNVGVIQT